MNAVRALMWNTIIEAIREKVLWCLLAFAVFAFVAARVVAPLALGEGRRVTIDLAMGAQSLFGLLLVTFVGHSLVHRELERGSVAFLFSRPVGRGEFILGKFLGLASVLAGAVVAMGAILALVLLASGYACGAELAASIGLTILELWILAALAILFASLASPILAGLFVLGAWVIGNAAGSFADLPVLFPTGIAARAVHALLWVVPRFDLYDGAVWLVHGTRPSPEQWAWSVSYAALYSAAVLLLARAAFARRSLLG